MQSTEFDAPLRLRDHWHWLLGGAFLLGMLWLLGPILMPFVVGAILGYVGDPVVDWLERRRFSRTWGVVLVFSTITLSIALLILLIAPMIYAQTVTLIESAPDALRWIQDVALPKLGINVPENLRIDANYIRRWLTEHWQEATGAAGVVAKSSLAVLATIANIALIPVVAFYLLRDWDRIVEACDQFTPPRWRPLSRRLAGECDEVLGSFIRGQGLVMLAMAIYYTVTLSIAGLKLSLVVGLIAGTLTFVPYLGFAVGFAAAMIAVLVQDPSFWPITWVVIIFVVAQMLEGNVLVPLLVGDKIGIHPVTVIFAVMAGGQLMGFTGVLIALPVAAILAVLFRELDRRWRESDFYRWGAPAEHPPEALPPPPAPIALGEGPPHQDA
ncbi:MAG: AI-2E family transporter [Pseudomonadota bacterium]